MGYILLVFSADGRDDTPFMSTLLVVERDTLSTSALQALERDTHTMHIHAAGSGKGYILHVHPSDTAWCYSFYIMSRNTRSKVILSTAFLPRLCQSCIGILASAFRLRYRWSRISPLPNCLSLSIYPLCL